MHRPLLFIRKNIAELYLLIISLMMVIGATPNYLAIVLSAICIILLLTQQKVFGMTFGILIGFIGAYLCLALLSDIVKIQDFTSFSSIQSIVIGSLLCLSLLLTSGLMIKKYFLK